MDLTPSRGARPPRAQWSTLKPETRDARLEAIAKAHVWIDDLLEGRVASLAEIARRERKVARHVRLLAPLAFARLISEIIDGTAPAELTVTGHPNAVTYL